MGSQTLVAIPRAAHLRLMIKLENISCSAVDPLKPQGILPTSTLDQ